MTEQELEALERKLRKGTMLQAKINELGGTCNSLINANIVELSCGRNIDSGVHYVGGLRMSNSVAQESQVFDCISAVLQIWWQDAIKDLHARLLDQRAALIKEFEEL